MKLLDLVKRNGVPKRDGLGVENWLFDDVICVDGTNVVDYMLANHANFSGKRLDEVIPNAMPPFDSMLIEARISNSCVIQRSLPFPVKTIGLFVMLASDKQSIWTQIITGDGHEVGRLPYQLFMRLDKSGAITDVQSSPQGSDEFTDLLMVFITGILLMSISFMHCKNVNLTQHVPDARLQSATMKRCGVPLVKYYTLDIDPMKEVLRREGGIARNGIERAMHICRGHFATYTEERPLFGRVVGTFWKPMHVKGKESSGRIEKEYRVLPGKGEVA